jgi:diguanylate cyclase (GGDEF)-like protein
VSIRFKILLGCLSLTLITVVMGAFAQRSQQELGSIATRLYDEAFMAVSYLREAQNGLMTLHVALDKLETPDGTLTPTADVTDAPALLAAAVPDILSSLQVAHDRAMSPEGEAATAALRTDIEALGTGPDGTAAHALIAELDGIQQDFDTVVEIYAGDGYVNRVSVGETIEQSSQLTWIVVGLSVIVAFVITFLLNRSIVPALREVVRIAKSIAAGRLDNKIVPRDGGETAEMLEALSVMQGSIASNIERINALMARRDALTGLPNRVLFREHVEAALGRGPGKPFSVLSLDLDGFKAINDTLGHPVGDALLKAVAERLQKAAPDADVVARLGGDEFAVIQQQAGEGDIPALAQRLVDAMHLPFGIEGHRIVLGASIGIAASADLGDVTTAGTPDTLLKNADLALYRAKADGRGTYRFFEADMDARLQARRSLELDLQMALERKQFEILYQPLVDTKQGRVAGFEALLRWHHPVRGTVSPAEFIPVAEETGLIRAIGAWVLEQACREAATWPGDVKVAVNLSPVQFTAGNLVETVSRALKQSGLAANRLELEITESLLLQDNGAVLDMLHQLRELGTRIAMDDFGTGYSSLSYLQRFPFDKIKIDQSFIRQLSVRPDSIAIVRAVIGLGRSLGMAIIAEGVETQEQLEVLQAEGCWDVQGYLFSPPRPVSNAGDLMRTIGADRKSVGARSAA